MLKEKLLNSNMHDDLKSCIFNCETDSEVINILQVVFKSNTVLIILYYLNIISDDEYITILDQEVKPSKWR